MNYTHAIIETSHYYGASKKTRLATGERGQSLLFASLASAKDATAALQSNRIGHNESSPPSYRPELISRLSNRLRMYL